MIPESPFYLEGCGGLYEFIEQRLKENGHVVIVLAEGAGQDHVAQNVSAINEKDESGNRLLLDAGLWLSQKIKVCSAKFLLLNSKCATPCPPYAYQKNVHTHENPKRRRK